MTLTLASVANRKSGSQTDPASLLSAEYLQRIARYLPAEDTVFPTEAALLTHAARTATRPAATLILFDSRGELATSEQFAQHLANLRDTGAQRLIYAIGPADGWSAAALARASRSFSFGRITMPHLLARAVAAEQIYRAFTILAGHPYHSGH